MPGRVSVPARRKHSESDDAEDSDNSSVSVPGSASSKRRRLSDGSASPSPSPDPVRDSSNSRTDGYHPEEEEEEDGDEDDDDAPANFQPGSIVRVKLTNFVTYTKAEFHLGPSLNMIIGPNGTGKSTLVCAICLGLGWPPKHLGRAKDAAEFVKHGQKEAEIEIELQAGKGQKRNPVILRRIRREGNKSTYTLNKDQVPEKDIRRLAQSFSIQIDNLCQFLPQDRVVEFAGLSPIALLEETERAAAAPVVYEQHQQLKKFHEELRKEELGQKQNRETLTTLQNRQNAARADVERLQERQSIQEKVGYMEKYRPFIRYAEARDRANEAKRNKKNAERALAKLQENLAPQLQAMEAHQGYVDEIEAAVVQRQKMVTMAESKASKIFDAQHKAQNEIDRLEKEKAAEKQRARGRAKRIQESEEKIKEIRQQMNEPPMDFDPAEFNARKRAKQRDVTEIETNKANLQNRMGEVADKVAGLKRELQSTQRALDDLHSKEGQQVNKLKAVSKDGARAWEWIQDNRDKFQGQVFGPPIVECSVKDKKYAKALENSVGKAMTVFTVTNQHDFRLALDQLTGRDGLGLSQIEVQSVSHPSSYFKAPISREDLPEHGLAGWALDYIEGPDEVLSMLCENAQLHRSGISFGKINEAQHDRLMNSPIQRWLDQQSRYTVTKRYGRTAVGSTALREAQIWTDSQVDAGASHEIKKKMTEIKGELELLKEEEGKLAKNMKGQDQRLKDLEQEIGTIEEEKSALQRARTNFNLLPQRLESEQEKMNPLIEANDEFRNKINKWLDEQDDLALQRASHALDYAKNVNHLQTLYDSLLKAEIMLIEAGSELACLKKENEQTRQVLAQTAQEVQRIAQEYSQVYNEAKRQHKLCNDAVCDRTEEEQQFHDELAQANTSSETLEAEISAMQARLDLLHGGGGANTLRDYEKRQADIENYERRLEDTTQRVAGVKSQIKETQEKWEPVVDRLVEQISDAFSHHFKQIDCAGQVVVHKDENFEKWAIQIQVKFRANEPLSNLDASRQSGGERAVSTIFYLLSLQSLARSPFRVVDEINQGMDPRNERKVHERMVDIACKEHTSQYFLVTPKLLHGLKYHKRMKVHCIASGEHMPKDGQRLDFMELAQVALRVKAAA